MNEYKITYTLDGEDHYLSITERTEKAAQKRLRGIYKAAERVVTRRRVRLPDMRSSEMRPASGEKQ